MRPKSLRNLFVAGFVILFTLVVNAETNVDVLTKVWKIGASKACTQDMRSQFNNINFTSLKSQLNSETNRDNLRDLLNPFLKSLGWSHTEFTTSSDETFYLLRDHASSINPNYPPAPLIVNPGIQLGLTANGYYVREVLDGFPARQAGILKNDKILRWKNQTFDGTWGLKPSTDELLVERNNRKIKFTISTLLLNWNDAFLEATKLSEKIILANGKRIGYVHLWTGVHKDSATVLREIVERLSSQKVEGMIYDIRGGYGGAWWEHLDPFFKDRAGFFEAEVLDGDDKSDKWVSDPQDNKNAYLGPLVVLTNEGSRSGKEALAYQFKKSQRAVLVGANTAGYFSGGGYFFADQPADYLLYLCVMRITLDGNKIEGVGVSPDIAVPFDTKAMYADSQLETAIKVLAK